jgi:hypothetical protein
MTSNEPGERPRLAQPPSARYETPAKAGPTAGPDRGSALPGPLARSIVAAIIGAAGLVLVGAVLASTSGLLLVAGTMGAAVGLLLARAAVRGDGSAGRAVARRTVGRIGMALALAAVVAAYIGIWLYARQEGGTLDLVDYLWTAFGPFVPGVALVAVVAAAWGASAGPVQR